MAIAFLLDVDRCKANELAALQDIVGDVVGRDIESETVATDVRQAQEAKVDLLTYVKRESSDLADDGKWVILATLRRILERVSPLMQYEQERLLEVGKAIGLGKKHINEFLATPLED